MYSPCVPYLTNYTYAVFISNLTLSNNTLLSISDIDTFNTTQLWGECPMTDVSIHNFFGPYYLTVDLTTENKTNLVIVNITNPDHSIPFTSYYICSNGCSHSCTSQSEIAHETKFTQIAAKLAPGKHYIVLNTNPIGGTFSVSASKEIYVATQSWIKDHYYYIILAVGGGVALVVVIAVIVVRRRRTTYSRIG